MTLQEVVQEEVFTREFTPAEYIFDSPLGNITMAARIKGNIPLNTFESAVQKMPIRHPILRTRTIRDEMGRPSLTSEGIPGIPVTVVPRESPEQWQEVCTEELVKPFNLDTGPYIRITLVYSPEVSEMVISILHLLGDAMSLAYLVRDILEHVVDPEKEVERLANPPLYEPDNIPVKVKPNFITRFIMNMINKKWDKQRVIFDNEDNHNIIEPVQEIIQIRFLPWQLTRNETSRLVQRCHEEQVTVNTALLTAFMAATDEADMMEGVTKRKKHATIIPVNIRNRLIKSPGEAFGLYASGYKMKYRYNEKKSFWDNARAFNNKIKEKMNDKEIFGEQLISHVYMDPSIIPAIKYYAFGKFLKPDASRYDKLSKLHEQDCIINKFAKKMDFDGPPTMSVLLTNIGNLDFPEKYGDLTLVSLMLVPGGNLRMGVALGVVTASGKLFVSVNYIKRKTTRKRAMRIRKHAIMILMGAMNE